jgi:glycerol-3-phosphate acyltransferase PlsY
MTEEFLIAVAAGYLLGSLSFAVIVSRLMGLADPRSYGSATPAPPMCCAAATSRRPR